MEKKSNLGEAVSSFFQEMRNDDNRRQTWMLQNEGNLKMGQVYSLCVAALLLMSGIGCVSESGEEGADSLIMGILLITIAAVLICVSFYCRKIRLQKLQKYERYRMIINQEKGRISVYNIAATYPGQYEDTLKDLQTMIDKHFFEGAFIDYKNGMLVLDPNNPDIEERDYHLEAAFENKDKNSLEPKTESSSVDTIFDVTNDIEIDDKLDEIKSILNDVDKYVIEHNMERNSSYVQFKDFYIPRLNDFISQYNSVDNRDNKLDLKSNLLETLNYFESAATEMRKELTTIGDTSLSSELNAMKMKLSMDGFKKPHDKEPFTTGE